MQRLIVPLLALVLAPAGLAASFSFSVSSSSSVTVATVTLSGDDQAKTFTISGLASYSGTGNTAGWNITASATTLTSGSHTLPALQVTAGSSSCLFSCTTNPTNGIAYPVTLSGTAEKIYDAAVNTGKGFFTVTSTYEVTYPASALTGTYTATVTESGTTGP